MSSVKYSRNTVGCRVGDEIFVHPELYKYPELYHSIMQHEENHSSGFNTKDFLMDLSNDDLRGVKKQYYKFIFNHPRTLLGFLPISRVGTHWAIDLSLSVFYAFAIIFMIIIGVVLK